MKYVLSLSFGKDSMALLIEVIKRKLPLDYVIFCDIRFNDEISGEHPIMAQWIPEAEKILKDKFGVDVIHLKGKWTFESLFFKTKEATKRTNPKHIGQIYGFPYLIGAWCNSRLKLEPIKKFERELIKEGESITWYVGIASDEPKRLERYKQLETDKIKYITLADLKISEIDAFEICKQNNLLSPKYSNSFRGGCWFCNKQSLADLWNLWHDYPEYYKKLEDMEKQSPNTFKIERSLKDIRKQFEQGYMPKKKKRHKQLSLFD